MRRKIEISCVVFIMAFTCLGVQGKELVLKGEFGEDSLLLPREIICHEKEIFVFDSGGAFAPDQKIKVFSTAGKFIEEIGSIGEGPGEYSNHVKNFYIFDKKIYILDELRNRMHIFSSETKKFLGQEKLSFPKVINSVMEFVISGGGSIYYTQGNLIKGEKQIVQLNRDLKPVRSFLDCIPFYKNREEFLTSSGKKETPQDTRNIYINLGYLAISADKVYYAYWLLNRVYEFSFDGKMLNKHSLPLDSIDKTVKIIKAGKYDTIEHKLNYDLKFRGGQLLVLSRDQNGSFVIFVLDKGRFKEKYRMKEELFSFDIMGNTLYGIDREGAKIYSYDLK